MPSFVGREYPCAAKSGMGANLLTRPAGKPTRFFPFAVISTTATLAAVFMPDFLSCPVRRAVSFSEFRLCARWLLRSRSRRSLRSNPLRRSLSALLDHRQERKANACKPHHRAPLRAALTRQMDFRHPAPFVGSGSPPSSLLRSSLWGRDDAASKRHARKRIVAVFSGEARVGQSDTTI